MLDSYQDILKPAEVCEILRIGKRSFYKLIDSGQLSAYKTGKNWKIPKTSVLKYINSNCVNSMSAEGN